jgi:hypothetical protein
VRNRHATILLLSFAALALACVDLSPPKGPASISQVRLPSAFVVRGDVMRDSTGTPAIPIVNEFDAAGHVIAGKAAQFFITDSAPAAHFDATTGSLVGDKLGIVHLIGQVGSLQTPSVAVAVTVAPTSMTKGTGALDTIKAPISQDTTVVGTSSVPILVRGVGDTAVQGVLVHYVLTRTLVSNDATRPAVYFADQTGKQTLTDTTDATGSAARDHLIVRARLLADVAVATGQKVDSVIVQASASYKGTPLAGSPVTFVFHVVGVIAP